jgi:hypothetical protein
LSQRSSARTATTTLRAMSSTNAGVSYACMVTERSSGRLRSG